MVYMIEPINHPYDVQEPIPSTLGFLAPVQGNMAGFELQEKFKPVPPEYVFSEFEVTDPEPQIGKMPPMPDFFYLTTSNWYCSSRFRAVLDEHAPDCVGYVDVKITMPASKNPASAYYFMNILGRGRITNWKEELRTRGAYEPIRVNAYKRIFLPPPTDHSPIWLEEYYEEGGRRYCGNPRTVFVTDRLSEILDVRFPGQCHFRKMMVVAD